MALPYLDNPATLDAMTVMELDGLVAKLNAYLSQQHNAQGGHTAITADSVTVTGAVTAPRAYLDRIFQFRRPAALGEWTTVPYAATHFATVGAGTSWGVDAADILTHRYTLIGHTLHYSVVLTNTDVTGAPTELLIQVPSGLTVGAYFAAVCLCNQAGAGNTPAIVYAPAGETALHVITMTGAPWTATAADNTTVFLDITCEVIG